MSKQETGPIYGVELIDTLPLDGGMMRQQLPSRDDLERVAKISERTVAGYEVLLEHYRRLRDVINQLVDGCEREMDDQTQGPSETCSKMWERIEAAREAVRKSGGE